MSKFVYRSILFCLMLLSLFACSAPPSTATPEVATAVSETITPTFVPPTSSPVPTDTPTATPTATAVPTTLNMAIDGEPATLDLQYTSDPLAFTIFSQICQPLLTLGFDGKSAPLLADSWQFAPDGLSLTMTLKQGITFQDGTPFNAEAVLFTFTRLQNSGTPDTPSLSPLYDAFKDVTMETPDSQTIVFHFSEPTYDFLTTLRNDYAAIISPTAVTKDEVGFGRAPVCTGPYQVAQWETGQYILLTKNPDFAWPAAYYENQGPAFIDQVKINFITQNSTLYLALLNDEIDFAIMSSPQELAEISTMPDRFTTYKGWFGGISFLGFNYQRVPTSDLLVRQALAHAIDKQAIVDFVYPGMAEPAYAILAPSVFGFSPELKADELQYDPDQSRQLLAEAGYVDSDGDGIVEKDGLPLHLVLLTTTDEVYADVFTIIQSQLQEIGVEIELNAVPSVADITPTGEFDLLLYHYNWPYPSALSLFLGTDRIKATNRVWYTNPEMDALMKQSQSLPEDSPEKLALIIQAQQMILRDVPWQPLWDRQIVTAVNSRIQGVKVHPSGGILWHDAFIQPNQP